MIINNKSKQNKAFTLVELSIVIVIIGLLVGGVTAGVSLVAAAKLHSDISKFKEYKMAYSIFMEQYNAVPGDMKNATSYWPSAAGNGNGNKLIDFNNELVYAWQQLALAKLVNGVNEINTQSPRPSSSPKTAQFLMWGMNLSMYGVYSPNTVNSVSTYDWNIGLSPAQGLAIDTKIDDGIPTRGKVFGLSNPTNDCIKQSDGTTNATHWTYSGIGSYNLAQPAQVCSVSIILHR